jgi:aryl-alcohol dehydrogenase-like predicted oxidoreductase
VHAALESGVTLFDTADFYAMGDNELLLAEALRGRDRDGYQLSVKFGMLREPGPGFGGFDGRPEAVKNFLAYSLSRLGTDHIDIYRPARLDPAVPIEETVGAIKEMIDAGYVRHIGLSEVDAATIRRAHAVHRVSDLQIEYSLISRVVEADVLPTLRELGIGLTAYGVLSRGLISGHWSAGRTAAPGDSRGFSPRRPIPVRVHVQPRRGELSPALRRSPLRSPTLQKAPLRPSPQRNPQPLPARSPFRYASLNVTLGWGLIDSCWAGAATRVLPAQHCGHPNGRDVQAVPSVPSTVRPRRIRSGAL